MKKLVLSIFSLIAFNTIIVNAQEIGVGIETESVGESSLLEFPENADKGILLPRVKNEEAAGTVAGTFIYNMSDKKVYIYGDNKWVALTDESSTRVSNNRIYSGDELDSKGVVIEDGTSTEEAKPGVLSLESTERALVLPNVEDVTLLPNPLAGLICYDKKSSSLAIFNGSDWYFWR